MLEIVASQNETKNHTKWHGDTLIYGTNDKEFAFPFCRYIKNFEQEHQVFILLNYQIFKFWAREFGYFDVPIEKKNMWTDVMIFSKMKKKKEIFDLFLKLRYN